MTDERRYHDNEVAQIFEAAAAPAISRRGVRSAEGRTLAELQAIGREVGIAPERIAQAASSLERSTTPVPRRTTLGMPISVGRTLELPRPLTDREWALLVTDLRETFYARGSESSHGGVRQWSNGNLHALVEPTASGYRLRLGTVKGDAMAVNLLGAGAVLMGLIMILTMLLGEEAGGDLFGALMIAFMGAGAFAFNALRLPRWAREREEQMEYIVERARALISAGRGESEEE
ncbi:MAG: hypothetical protein ACRELX_16065 [Longimicrobiales bacterium]